MAQRREWVNDRSYYPGYVQIYILAVHSAGNVIFAPNDTISAEKQSNAIWDAVRGTHSIPGKKK